jgi:hypothetical protein
LHHSPESPPPLATVVWRQPTLAAFCLLFVGLQKVGRLAGRVPPVLELVEDPQLWIKAKKT